MSSMEQYQGQVLTMLGGLNQRMDRCDERMARIERRPILSRCDRVLAAIPRN
jgi:hypothetical protein